MFIVIQPHEILLLNNLPHSVLTSHSHLLRTRSTLLISRRRVPRASVPIDNKSTPVVPINAVKDEERERERAIKRFQLLTKTVDPGVGAAYLALDELEQNLPPSQAHPLEYGSGEAMPDSSVPEGGDSSKKKPLPEVRGGGGENSNSSREHRALERYYLDEEWERDHALPSSSSLLSKLKSKPGASDSTTASRGWRAAGFGLGIGVKS